MAASTKSHVVLTYRLDADRYVQAAVHVSASYPDAVDEARAVAMASLHDMLALLGVEAAVAAQEQAALERDRLDGEEQAGS